MVVDQHDRCVATCAHAFAFDKGKFAVGRGFAVADTEFFLQIFAGIHAAAQGAGQVGADGQFVFSDRLEVVHIVESSDFVGLCRRDADIVCDKGDGLGEQASLFRSGQYAMRP